MSFITPAWMLCIPERDDPKYFNWLVTKAAADGVPDHVIEHLVKKYFSLPLPDGLSMIGDDIILSYVGQKTRLVVYDKLVEEILDYE